MPKLKPGRMYAYVGDFNGALGTIARVPGHRSKFFSYDRGQKFGEAGAKQFAIEHRAKMVSKILGE